MNQVGTPSPVRFRFGVFEANLQAGELRKNGLKIKLQEQPFRVLSLLLERAGEVVTREELRQTLWSSDTFVDFEHSLNTSIKKLRQALGDAADNPRFVETLARRGYRFIAPVEQIGRSLPSENALSTLPAVAASQEQAHALSGSANEVALPRTVALQRKRWMWLSAALLLAIVATAWLWPHHSRISSLAQMKVSRLTSFPGIERDGVLSPDGKQLAFA